MVRLYKGQNLRDTNELRGYIYMITYVMTYMINFIVPFLFILGIALFNSIIFHKKFEYVLPMGILECILIIYVCGFFNLKIGFVLCICLAGASVPMYIAQRKTYSIREMMLTDLFVAFIILYTIVFVLNLGKYFFRWDEFSHWGVMAKEMYRLDRYYYLPEAILTCHKDYPPLTTIMQYLWCNLCGGYKERHLYNAKIMLSLSMFFPVVSNLISHDTKRSIANKILNAVSYACLLIVLSLVWEIGEAGFYRTIYTESVLVSIFIYAVYLFIKKEDNRNFSICCRILVLSGLLLSKQIAIYFFGVVLILYCVRTIWEIYESKCWAWRRYCVDVGCFLIPFVLWRVWEYCVQTYAPVGQFAPSKFAIENILNVIQGNGLEYQYVTMKLYFNVLVQYPLIKRPFPMTYISLIVILPIITLVFLRLCHNKCLKQKGLLLICTQTIACIGYIVVMLISYLFGFGEGEALILACYDRYMISLLYPILILDIIYILLVIKERQKYESWIYVMCAAVGLAIVFIPISRIEKDFLPGVCYDYIEDGFEKDSQNINENTEEHARVFVICQETNNATRDIIAYKCLPRDFNNVYYSVGDPYYEGDVYTRNVTVEELRMIMSEYDYVYLSLLNEEFVRKYGELFNPPGQVENSQLYKVVEADGNIHFEFIPID